jgi:hypothetical protein
MSILEIRRRLSGPIDTPIIAVSVAITNWATAKPAITARTILSPTYSTS